MEIKVTNLMIEILEKYTTLFDEPLYSRKLSVLINRNHRSIDICLKKMEDLKLLGSKRKGKEIEYYLNFNNPSINPFLCLSEETKLQKAMKKYPPSIKKTFLDLRKEFLLYTNNLNFGLLFGSFAKEYYTKKSDLDLLIVAENKKIINKRIEKVENIWGVEISPTFMTLQDFEHNLKTKNLTLQDILKNHLVLIGGENFWGEIIKWKL